MKKKIYKIPQILDAVSNTFYGKGRPKYETFFRNLTFNIILRKIHKNVILKRELVLGHLDWKLVINFNARYPSVIFYTFASSSPESFGQLQPNLAQSISA